MRTIADELRMERENLYGALTLGFGIFLWFVIAYAVWSGLNSVDPKTVASTWVYLAYGIAFGLFVVISAAFYRAAAFGNMIMLSPQQFPALYQMVVAGSQALGMKQPPRTFLYNSSGLFNAFARRLFGGEYVFLTSAIVEATSEEQVRFIIGHELGHHAAGHLNAWKNFLRFPSRFVPFLYPAYSRAREYTCDRIGAYVSQDVSISQSSLQMLGCGCAKLNGAMNCAAFTDQEEMVPPIAGFFSEIFRSHPRLTRRVAAIAAERSLYVSSAGPVDSPMGLKEATSAPSS